MKLKIKKLTKTATVPSYGTTGSAGMDLYADISDKAVIFPDDTVEISTGIAVAIPKGYVGLIFARSGLSIKHGIAPANKVGVIDSDYRGEVIVALHNHGRGKYIVKPNDRIAQMIIVPIIMPEIELTDVLDATERGNRGFGSTGR